jgi:N-acetyl-anhydromuramyl-L-alanine amidase AmpD
MIDDTSTLTIEITAERPWTHAHQREALAYLLTLARDGVLATEEPDVVEDEIQGHGWVDVVDEEAFTLVLVLYEADPVEALRFVRDLAEGRKERVITHYLIQADGRRMELAPQEVAQARVGVREWNAQRNEPRASILRVTSIRRVA